MSDKSFSSFSPRSFEPGTTLKFYSSSNGEFASVVKHMRSESARTIIIKRIEALSPFVKVELVKEYEKLVSLEIGQLDVTRHGESVLVIRPVNGLSVQSMYRSYPWRQPLDKIGRGLAALLCMLHQMETRIDCDHSDIAQQILCDFNAKYGENLASSKTIKSLAMDSPSLKVCVVHNDLSPGNLLFDKKVVSLIDWEYWEKSYSVFNMLDILTTFGPVTQRLKLGRRRVEDYMYLLQLPVTKLPRAFECGLRTFWTSLGLENASTTQLDALLRVYLASKSTLQWRSYGSTGEMDVFWKSVYDEFNRSPARYMTLLLGLSSQK